MKGPGSKALRKGRISAPQARYLITKNIAEDSSVALTRDENPEVLIHGFFTAARRTWFNLLAFVVMPDHYHLIIKLGIEWSLPKTVGKINENAARLIKRKMNTPVRFWQHGFHDHLIRPTENLEKYIEYVHMNPVKSGLVEKPEDWRWSSAHPDYASDVDYS